MSLGFPISDSIYHLIDNLINVRPWNPSEAGQYPLKSLSGIVAIFLLYLQRNVSFESTHHVLLRLVKIYCSSGRRRKWEPKCLSYDRCWYTVWPINWQTHHSEVEEDIPKNDSSFLGISSYSATLYFYLLMPLRMLLRGSLRSRRKRYARKTSRQLERFI